MSDPIGNDGSDRNLGDGSDVLGGPGLDPDDAPTTDTTVGDTAAADAEFEGRPLDDATTGDDSATSADAGFGDAAPEYPSEDTEETLPPSDLQPESQGEDPVIADLGEEGEGDLGPNDV